MTVYVLFHRAQVPFFDAGVIVPLPTDGPIPQVVIAPEQTFQFTVVGQPGASISATCQIVVSTNGKNWIPYFDPVTVSGISLASAGFGGSQNWPYYSSYLTAISGTNARATLEMNG